MAIGRPVRVPSSPLPLPPSPPLAVVSRSLEVSRDRASVEPAPPSPTPVPGGAPCPFPLFKDLRPGVVGGSGVVVVGVRLSLAGPLATPPGCAPQLAPLPPRW